MTLGLISESRLASPTEDTEKLTQKEDVGEEDLCILRLGSELKPAEDCADLKILRILTSRRVLPPADVFDLGNLRIFKSRRVLPSADIFDLGNLRIFKSRRVLPPTDGAGLRNLGIFESSVEKTSTMVGKRDVSFTRDEVKEGREEDIEEFSRLLKPRKGNLILPYRGYKLQGLDIELPLKLEKLKLNADQGYCSEVYKFCSDDQVYIAKYVDLRMFRYAEIAVPVRYHMWLKQHGINQPQEGLVKIFAVYVEETYVVIVQEYAGDTVENHFKDRAVGDVTLRSVMKQGLSILQQLSWMGISLGDIKPENMAMKNGMMRFIDYGSSSTSMDRNFGTNLSIVYKAPEYIQNKPLSPAGDIFAFGVTVISLVTEASEWKAYKRRWEEDENWDELSREASLFDLLQPCKPELQHLLRNMLTQQPESRITAEHALEHEYFKEPLHFDPGDTLWPASGREFPACIGQGDTEILRGATEIVWEEKMEEQLMIDQQQSQQVSELGKSPGHMKYTVASLTTVPTLVEETGQHEQNLRVQPHSGQLYSRRTAGNDHPSNMQGQQIHQHAMVDQPPGEQQQPENDSEDMSCEGSDAVLVPTTVEDIGDFKLAIGDQPHPGQCQPEQDSEGGGALQAWTN